MIHRKMIEWVEFAQSVPLNDTLLVVSDDERHQYWTLLVSDGVSYKDVVASKQGVRLLGRKLVTEEELHPLRTISPTGGLKDEKIQRFDLIPPRMLQQLATLYGVGAAKYDDRNWELGIEFGKLFAALNRHLWKWWGGEEFDEEMGVHHLINVIWNATALFELLHTHPELDDSPVKRKSNG